MSESDFVSTAAAVRLRRERVIRFGLALLLAAANGGPGLAQNAQLGPAPELRDHGALSKSQAAFASAAAAKAGWYDVSDREAVRHFYNAFLVPSRPVAMGWTGSQASCAAGDTVQPYKDAVSMRVNWFRAMAGVPAGVALDSPLNSKDQDAALMMSANRQLSHAPPSSWSCYTSAGAEAASNSNICYGFFNDPGCIELYMNDFGSGNTAAGHRRWILYPQTEVMGTGDVASTGSGQDYYATANALWVLPSSWPPRPATRDEFVAWPPKGYVPYQLVSARWSFSYAGADFSGATVSMTRAGAPVPVQLETPHNGYGENTLVWIADNMDSNSYSSWPLPVSDTTLTVTVSNVLVSGQSREFTYQVTIFDPESPEAPSATPVAAFRDTGGSIQVTRYGSASLWNGGGVLSSDPAAAQSFSGDTFAVARDASGSLWANVFDQGAQSWSSWSYGGGITKGLPAIGIAAGATASVAARDTFNSYWLTSYTGGGAFGPWTYLAGIFSTDPAMATCPDGSVYIVGKDNWNSLWSGRYIPGSGFQGWQWGQGIVKGKPSITCGTDSVVYVAVRDNWDSLWMARVQGNTWLGWSYGGGIMSGDPQVTAPGDGLIYTVLRDTWGGVWYRGYTQGTSGGWQAWVMTGGVLQDAAPAGLAGELYISGRDSANDLWWYRKTGNQWTNAGHRGVAAGPLAASPR